MIANRIMDGMRKALRDWPAAMRLRVPMTGWVLLASLVCLPMGAGAQQQGAINNTASASFANFEPLRSNTVSFVVRTPATIDFMIYGTNGGGQPGDASGAQCADASGAFAPVPAPAFADLDPLGTSSGAPSLDNINLVAIDAFPAGTPLFVTLTDINRNLDPTVRDSVEVTLETTDGDRETLILFENGTDSAEFLGYIQTWRSPPNPLVQFDCALGVNAGTQVTATYTDTFDVTDTTDTNVLVDPFGIVFNAETGAPVNGATVAIFLADANGDPIPHAVAEPQVFGDNLAPNYPIILTTGDTIVHEGITYAFPDGGYRFPLLPPGDYVLVVTPPDGFTAPTTVPLTVLQTEFGDVFVLSDASLGGSFPVRDGPAVQVDIPIDPNPLQMSLEKIASRDNAGIGDFVQYRLTLSNTSTDPITAPLITDDLPVGFRYESGSLRIDGLQVDDPAINANGTQLEIQAGVLDPVTSDFIIPAGGRQVITYVTSITAGAVLGEAPNTATATATSPLGNVRSNTATAVVQVRNEFFTDHLTLIGRVVEIGEQGCGTEAADLIGVPNIRMLMEDGTYVNTDADGHYHFRNVSPGTHVVQLDIDTIPQHMELVPCIRGARHAGRTFSRFIDGRGGGLWREDFYLRPLPPTEAPVGIRLRSTARTVPEFFSFQANFGVRKWDLTQDDEAQLEQIAKQLDGLTIEHVEVSGHTSDVRIAPEHREEVADNYELSQRRARSAAVWLAGRLRLRPEKFNIIGMGPDQPVATNRTESGRARNRRVEVRVRVKSPIRYRIDVDAGAIPTEDVKVMLMAPEGVVLDGKTAQLDGKPLTGANIQGTIASFPIGNPGADWTRSIEITGELSTGTRESKELFKARFDTRKASLKDESNAELDAIIAKLRGKQIESVRVIGHTDHIRIAPENRHEFANNVELSEARAQTVADRLMQALNLSNGQIEVVGRGARQPIADNTTAEGRAQNRRVELFITERVGSQICGSEEYSAKAVATFATQAAKSQRTHVVENKHRCLIGRPVERHFEFRPRFDTRKAELRAEDRDDLNGIVQQLQGEPVQRLSATGHTDDRPIAFEHRDEFADNYVLSEARAKTVVDYLGSKLGVDMQDRKVAGMGPDRPLASNETPEGMQRNRRVEISATTGKDTAGGVEVTVPDSTRKAKQVVGHTKDTRPGDFAAPAKPRRFANPKQESFAQKDWAAGVTPGVGFIFPTEDYQPRIPVTYVAVKHTSAQTAELKVNGVPVHPLAFAGIQKSPDRKTIVSVWRSVRLDDGSNTLTAEITNKAGKVVQSLDKTVHFSGAPVRVELLEDESTLVADGISKPVIAVRLYDRWDRPVRPGANGNFSVSTPYRTAQEVEWENTRAIAGSERFEPTFQVEQNGVTYIELAPTQDSGAVTLNFTLADQRREEVRTWLEGSARDWILVGFAEGTVGYNNLKGNMRQVDARAGEDELYTDGESAFYAKGNVKGKWLLTAAYDSRRRFESDIGGRLLGTVDPNQDYTLFGDATYQAHDAPSAEKLYLRIERSRFYAMFGDYNTGLSVTELSRYNRTLTGFKSEYNGQRLAYNLFVSDTQSGYQRDEIRADGTSGLYFLSANDIRINSETVFIERRDRFTGIPFTQREQLQRHIDYDIDYINGTLFFRTPQLSRDNEFNPRFIVVEYESNNPNGDELNGGGRVEARFRDGRLRVGASGIHEDLGTTQTDLYGLDLEWRLNTRTELRVEAATSETESTNAANTDGKAYLAVLEHRGSVAQGQLYYSQQDDGFGMGQQSASESGTKKWGADMLFKLAERFGVRSQLYHLESMTGDTERDHGSAELVYQGSRGGVTAGVAHTVDKRAQGDEESTTALVGVNRNFFNQRLLVEARAETALGQSAEEAQSIDYPQRYLFGVSYRLTEATDVFLQHEITDGDEINSNTTRAGMRTRPWRGAALSSSVSQTVDEFGPRSFAVLGLQQGLILDENWSMDFSIDRSQTIQDVSGRDIAPITPNQPVASGSTTPAPNLSDFTALSVGANYLAEVWSWNGRLENRIGDLDERWGLTSNFLRQTENGKAFSTRFQAFRTRSKVSDLTLTSADLSLSWAWRPFTQKWSILDRLDLIYDKVNSSFENREQRKIVNNFVVNRVSDINFDSDEDREEPWDYMRSRNQRSQWTVFYGSKYVLDTFDGTDYSGFTHMASGELRWDIRQWLDFGIHGSVLHHWDSNTYLFSAGPSIGVSPVNNRGLSLGYNFNGFRDPDFDAADYTEEGVYLKVRFKFDQTTRLNGRDGRHEKVRPWNEDHADEQFWRRGRNVTDPDDDDRRRAGELLGPTP